MNNCIGKAVLNLKSIGIGCMLVIVMNNVVKAQGNNDIYSNDGAINDHNLNSHLLDGASKLYLEKKTTPVVELAENPVVFDHEITLPPASRSIICNEELYENNKKGVLVIGKMYKCSKCPNNHLLCATGFVITSDGYCVTNQHVFRQAENSSNTMLAIVAMDYQGNVYNIERVEVTSEKDDLAVFKINPGSNLLNPLRLGDSPRVGSDVSVIAHPMLNFYNFSKGFVSRNYQHKKHQANRMSITADFGTGSSGGPLFDNAGNVVGVVSSTYYIHSSDHKKVQMVIKESIPIGSLNELIGM